MNENIIRTISSEMNRYLNNYQMSKLQEVLYKKVEVEKKEIFNEEYVNKFINSKRLEGCSELTIKNYKIHIYKMLSYLDKDVRTIETDDIIDLLASSGIRISEFVNLNRDDINFENKSCLVFGKGKKMREVYFDGKAKLHMEEYLNNRKDDNKALFVSNNKPYERLQSRGIELMLQKLGKELGDEKVHPHKFRRTLTTKAIDKGMPIEQVQHLLGHTKIDTTLHYAFVNQNNVKISHRKYIC
ncbi:MAG: tyrosine-type recombinase/integrase [Bacilli bacterium]|nr:tyrosine-type recombinase/integrase [Bacilli bacterium]